MTDTKISALNADATPAGTDEFAVNQAGTTKKETLTQIKTFASTAPIWAGGTASANTWPKFSTGTLLTTPEVGALELDANCLYGTTDAGNRGVIVVRHFIRQHTSYTLTNTASAQQLFNGSTNGTLTLETGTYKFECGFALTSMSATTGNGQFQLVGSGGATAANVMWSMTGVDGALDTTAATSHALSRSSTSQAAMVAAGISTSLGVFLEGTFEVTGAGTIIPSIALANAAAAVVAAGSYFQCERVGSTSMVTVGQWT